MRVVRALASRFYYGWVIVAASMAVNVASSPLNAGVFSFFVAPMSDDLGWSRGALSWAFTWRHGGGRYLGAAARGDDRSLRAARFGRRRRHDRRAVAGRF